MRFLLNSLRELLNRFIFSDKPSWASTNFFAEGKPSALPPCFSELIKNRPGRIKRKTPVQFKSFHHDASAFRNDTFWILLLFLGMGFWSLSINGRFVALLYGFVLLWQMWRLTRRRTLWRCSARSRRPCSAARWAPPPPPKQTPSRASPTWTATTTISNAATARAASPHNVAKFHVESVAHVPVEHDW